MPGLRAKALAYDACVAAIVLMLLSSGLVLLMIFVAILAPNAAEPPSLPDGAWLLALAAHSAYGALAPRGSFGERAFGLAAGASGRPLLAVGRSLPFLLVFVGMRAGTWAGAALYFLALGYGAADRGAAVLTGASLSERLAGVNVSASGDPPSLKRTAYLAAGLAGSGAILALVAVIVILGFGLALQAGSHGSH